MSSIKKRRNSFLKQKHKTQLKKTYHYQVLTIFIIPTYNTKAFITRKFHFYLAPRINKGFHFLLKSKRYYRYRTLIDNKSNFIKIIHFFLRDLRCFRGYNSKSTINAKFLTVQNI